MSDLAGRRRAGLLIPLFSCPSTSSWGIGDIGDLAKVTRWMAAADLGVLQLLPMNEMAPGQSSPYSAISAMAIDPIFIDVPAVPDFAAIGGDAWLDDESRAKLEAVRRTPAVDYRRVRELKQAALAACFRRFVEAEWSRGTPRDAALKAFIDEQRWWLDDYALFRAIHAAHGERPWFEWPHALQSRDAVALEAMRLELADEILLHQYLQWIADEQWHVARAAANGAGIALFGDMPFMVDGDSADVWARQDEFSLEESVGVPPDAFSATGQDWGMPVYRWAVHAKDDYGWLRNRARRSASLYDGYRVDHLVGFYRTYARPKDGSKPFFTPADERAQRAQGERVLAIFREPGTEIVAEDLGTVPDFVRASLARMRVPGFKVFRWEREWKREGQPFRDPAEFPDVSVATSGTHDTESLVTWWEEAGIEERREVAKIATVQRLAGARDLLAAPYTPDVRDVLLEALYAAASYLLLIPVQDLFGWADRINEPATVGEKNWTYRLPWPSDRLDEVPEARERQQTLARWAAKYRRQRRGR